MSRIDAEKILLAMNDIDERLIAEADELRSGAYLRSRRRRRQALYTVLAAAACVGIILVAGRNTGLWRREGLHSAATQDVESAAAMAEESAPSDDAASAEEFELERPAPAAAAEAPAAEAMGSSLEAADEAVDGVGSAAVTMAAAESAEAESAAEDAVAGLAEAVPAAPSSSALAKQAAKAASASSAGSAADTASWAADMIEEDAEESGEAFADAAAPAAEAPAYAEEEAAPAEPAEAVSAAPKNAAPAVTLDDVLAFTADASGEKDARAGAAQDADTVRLTTEDGPAVYIRVSLGAEGAMLLDDLPLESARQAGIRAEGAAGAAYRWYLPAGAEDAHWLIREDSGGARTLWQVRE